MKRLVQSVSALSLLGGLFLTPGVATCSDPLFPTPGIKVAEEITYVAPADINNDGKLDLVVLHGDIPGSVSILFGNGDGTFRRGPHFKAGISPLSVSLADFNGDGALDMVLGGWHVASLLPGDGLGNFGPEIALDAPRRAFSVKTGDFNRDGNLDIVATSTNYFAVTLLLGNGDLTFKPPDFLSVGAYPTAIVIGDFTNDGEDDLAVANGAAPFGVPPSISLLSGRGDGTFDPQVVTMVSVYPDSLAAGDLDGNGTLDLVVRGGFGEKILILDGQRDSSFRERLAIPVADGVIVSFAMRQGAFHIADFNDDEVLDVLSLNNVSESLFLGNESGSLSEVRFGAWFSRALAVEDFDGNGSDDIVVGTVEGDIIVILRDEGRLEPPPSIPHESFSGPLVSADFNEDGFPDLAAVSSKIFTGREISLGLSDGVGGLDSRIAVGGGQWAQGMVAGDFDGDGELDIAVAYQGRHFNGDLLGSGIYFSFGNGQGDFQPPILAFGEGAQGSLATGDHDGDGFLDLAVVNIDTMDVSVHFGALSAESGHEMVFHGFQHPNFVALADVDSDGRDELLVLDPAIQTLSVLFTPSGGVPARRLELSTGENPRVVRTGDVTGDGLTDLVISNSVSSSVWIYPGDGEGAFGLVVEIPMSGILGDLALVHLDDDQVLDIAVLGGNVRLIFSCADGSFYVDDLSYNAGVGSTSILANDFDQDGRQDLAVSNVVNTVVLYNRGATGRLVDIDLAQAEGRNSINPQAEGVMPIAILSSPTFDATSVLTQTIRVSGASPRRTGAGQPQCVIRDKNRDGRQDLVCHVLTSEVTPRCNSIELFAETMEGEQIRGHQRFRSVPSDLEQKSGSR